MWVPVGALAERDQLDRHLLELEPAAPPDAVVVQPKPAGVAVVPPEPQQGDVLVSAQAAMSSFMPLASWPRPSYTPLVNLPSWSCRAGDPRA